MAAEKAPGLTPQERTILDELKARVAEASRRITDASRRITEAKADILAAKVYAVAALEALPPEAKSDGAAA
jgi:DNA replication initiation complex subunit (GINS family)